MKLKKKVIAAIASTLCFAAMMSLTAYASGDVAGAVTSTWNTARLQIVSVVNNVVFPQARTDRMDSCCDNLRLPHIHPYRSVVYLVYCVRRYDK